MGQSLKKFSTGNEEIKIIRDKVEENYNKYFSEATDDQKNSLTYFYRAVTETIEEINKTFLNTQFRVPSAGNLERMFKDHHQKPKGEPKGPLTKKEFHAILQEILTTESGFTGFGGAKDTLIYIFGVPIVALFFKERLFNGFVSNEVFISGVTSATFFTLAELNKI